MSESFEKQSSAAHAEDQSIDLKRELTPADGTTQLYDGETLCLIPTPSAHPNDPLNLKTWRKVMAMITVFFFGAIAIAMQQIMATFLPVFMLEYTGLDPKLLNAPGGLNSIFAEMGPPGGMQGSSPGMSGNSSSMGGAPPQSSQQSSNPLDALSNLPGAPPLSKVNLLSSLPILMVGLSNYFFIPLSVVFGRRGVLVICATIAWVACIWAGLSNSLESHIAARCVQAMGAGAVESLIPLIVQDMSFVHQRSRVIGMVWGSQGIITISLGIGANYIVARLSWRWLYFIGGIITAVSWVMIILFTPETRWERSAAELRGENDPLSPGAQYADIDDNGNRRSEFCARYGFFANGGIKVKDGLTAITQIIKSLILPGVLYFVVLNAVLLGIGLGSSLTATSVLLAPPYNWPFANLGLMVIPQFIASIAVAIFGGFISDKVANFLTKRAGGTREPEVHLWNLMFPLLCAVLGCVLYGIGGTYVYQVHWMCILVGSGMLTFAFLTVNVIGSVFCIESYPQLAGPVLVNVSSFRNIIGFAFTYGVPDWVADRGYMTTFAIFAGVIVFTILPLPLFFKFGKKWRQVSTPSTKPARHSRGSLKSFAR